jgi:hypothetical protein
MVQQREHFTTDYRQVSAASSLLQQGPVQPITVAGANAASNVQAHNCPAGKLNSHVGHKVCWQSLHWQHTKLHDYSASTPAPISVPHHNMVTTTMSSAGTRPEITPSNNHQVSKGVEIDVKCSQPQQPRPAAACDEGEWCGMCTLQGAVKGCYCSGVPPACPQVYQLPTSSAPAAATLLHSCPRPALPAAHQDAQQGSTSAAPVVLQQLLPACPSTAGTRTPKDCCCFGLGRGRRLRKLPET